ncbi:putative LRR receptor-like serine/threonine-protein kinase [Glycine max]|nr:putative LRR receptor-like serine/threonine-protein kinase [Glycine max]
MWIWALHVENIRECVALALLILVSDVMGAIGPNCAVKNNSFECIEMERKTLLKFKQSLNDPFHCLSSWVGSDCCKWVGVRCKKHTRKALLKGIPTNIGALHHLESVDLSNNHISGPIPSNMASLS